MFLKVSHSKWGNFCPYDREYLTYLWIYPKDLLYGILMRYEPKELDYNGNSYSNDNIDLFSGVRLEESKFSWHQSTSSHFQNIQDSKRMLRVWRKHKTTRDCSGRLTAHEPCFKYADYELVVYSLAHTLVTCAQGRSRRSLGDAQGKGVTYRGRPW